MGSSSCEKYLSEKNVIIFEVSNIKSLPDHILLWLLKKNKVPGKMFNPLDRKTYITIISEKIVLLVEKLKEIVY